MPTELINHPLISQRYFFPRQEDFVDPHWVDCGDHRLACHYSEVDAEAPTVVHFHGNGEVVCDYLDTLPAWFNEQGFNLLLAEYPGYGMSTGEPTLGAIVNDVAAIVESLPCGPEKLLFFGRSVGAIPAMHAASLWPDAPGLVIESGIADVLQRIRLRVTPEELGCDADELKEAVLASLDQEKKMRSFNSRVLVLHTQHDGIVDVSHARR
ncbi:alpha/beta hydrolase, partial [Myxococcota bacterium]|nr:alpha/beta hydrolase [Myxococcota bacterium]